MENEVKLQESPVSQEGEATVIVPDWTESEWFDVWLKLARREHEPVKN